MTVKLLYQVTDMVATITLNRPKQLNAIDFEMLDNLVDAIEEAAGDPEVRVLVIGGAGPSFCAGADVGQMVERKPAEWERIVKRYLDPVRAIVDMPKPSVVRCHGSVFGGGLGLSIASDFRVASASARFCAPFIKLAMTGCDMSSGYFLPRLIGLGRATEMMMTGRTVGADEAAAIGLVNVTVPDDELDKAVAELAEGLAARAPGAMELPKLGIRRSLDRAMEAEFDYEILSQIQLRQSADHREGGAAFFEKRKPVYTGE